MAVNSLAVMSPEGGLSRYLTEIRKFPMLAKDQEFMLAQRWKEHQDPDAAHQMVTSHLRLVAKIAMGYRGYGLPLGEVISMNRRLAGPDASLNAPLRSDSESEWQDWLQDDTQVSQESALAETEEHTIRMSLLDEAMKELSDRERHILTERRLKDDPTTLEELAAEYGVSRERVRQIEVRAFEKLQKAMRSAATERNLVDA